MSADTTIDCIQSSKQSGGRLLAVVVTYRRPTDLALTLDSLKLQTRQPDETLVVDNDPDGSARDIADRRGLPYVCTGDNMGPAGGIAVGMKWALNNADDDDMVALIDDDDPVTGIDILERLTELLSDTRSRGERCGGVGATGALYRRNRGDLVRVADSELHGAVPVDYIGGNQVPIYSIAAIRDVGTFETEFFFGFDDAEYGLRLRAAGWTLLVPGDLWRERRAQVGRLGTTLTPRAASAPPPWRQYYSARNAVHLARRYGTVRSSAETIVRGFIWSPGRRLLQGSPSGAWAGAKGTLAGLRGQLGRTVEPTLKQS
jgi:rhamnopyranosyl-N-acetylglucosaminyl-diphospho-decaprenol beta-1,3/1,4-galactofuranosyltransferase